MRGETVKPQNLLEMGLMERKLIIVSSCRMSAKYVKSLWATW